MDAGEDSAVAEVRAERRRRGCWTDGARSFASRWLRRNQSALRLTFMRVVEAQPTPDTAWNRAVALGSAEGRRDYLALDSTSDSAPEARRRMAR